MAIKLGNQEITLKIGSATCTVYLGDTLVESGDTPTPPTPTGDYKWLATYTGGTTSSAECDSSSAITQNEITLTDLVSAQIGQCVTSIDDGVFVECTSLTSVTIPDSVTSISRYAFYSCSGLTSVTIPNGVTSIGKSAFQECTSLTSVTVLAATPPTLERSNAFDETNDCPIYVPAASVDVYKEARAWTALSDRIQAIP